MSRTNDAGFSRRWPTVPLKHVTCVLNRGTAPNYVDTGAVRVIGQAANRDEGIDWGRTRFHGFDGDPTRIKGFLRRNDIIINSTGTGTLGRVGFFGESPDGTPCIADGHLTIARVRDEELDARFAYYWLSSKPFQEHIFAALVDGATNQIELSRERLGGAQIPLPPLEEQRRIANFLDAETVRIDRLMAVKERAFALLEERRGALTRRYCFSGLESNTPMRETEVGPFGRIPAHWTLIRNKNLMREVSDLSVSGEEVLLTVSHLTGVTPRYEKTVYMFRAESMVGYKRCIPGDLVINTMWAWMGALGVSDYSGIVSPAYGVYRFHSAQALPEYFDFLFRTPEYIAEMTRYSKGVWTSRLRLYPESFLALRTPVPPRSEQDAIVRALKSELLPDSKLQEAIRRSNALLAERRQALVTAAVTGCFDVTSASGRSVAEGNVR